MAFAYACAPNKRIESLCNRRQFYCTHCKRGQLQRQEHPRKTSGRSYLPDAGRSPGKMVRGKRTSVSERSFLIICSLNLIGSDTYHYNQRHARRPAILLRFGAHPAIVLVALFISFSITTSPRRCRSANLSGDSVIITEGAFEGLAIFTEPDGEVARSCYCLIYSIRK